MKTIAIFRVFKEDNSVIAMFPMELGTNNLGTCLSYMHVGQHASATIDLVRDRATRPATSDEIKPLFDELARIGYDLEIRQRTPSKATETRRQKINKIKI